MGRDPQRHVRQAAGGQVGHRLRLGQDKRERPGPKPFRQKPRHLGTRAASRHASSAPGGVEDERIEERPRLRFENEGQRGGFSASAARP